MDKDKFAKKLGMSEPDINAIREAVVAKALRNNTGNRVLVLISQYPFLIIGRIVKVMSDYVFIHAEVTNISELDGETFRVHIDNIEVFYIEEDGMPIPDIRNVSP